MYHKIELDRAYKVHRQYHSEITAADEALREMQAPGNPPGASSAEPDSPAG